MACIAIKINGTEISDHDDVVMACFRACATGAGSDDFASDYSILNEAGNVYRRCVFDEAQKSMNFADQMIRSGFNFADSEDSAQVASEFKRVFVWGHNG